MWLLLRQIPKGATCKELGKFVGKGLQPSWMLFPLPSHSTLKRCEILQISNPETKTAEKCTFCYHRIVKGLSPACVEACPTQARIFGEVKKKASPLMRFMRKHAIGVLKPSLNTEPKVFYANMDMEVR